ncbi:MAG: homocysteine S-methyltransferase family protein [Actinobacteria bacterium]|nr:homocysteine S-methyltransferase family protein [Actinomycetota bacterium]
MSRLNEFLEKRILVLDGAMGTSLFARGYADVPEKAVLEAEDIVFEIHRSFLQAGSDAIETNTFGANRVKLQKFGLSEKIEEINLKASEIARRAAGDSGFVFGSIGPTGLLAEPIGKESFDYLYQIFKEQAVLLARGGVDAILLETFIDIQEAKIAALAAIENTGLPVFVTMTFNSDLKTDVSASSPEAVVGILEPLNVQGVGANCSLGPSNFVEIARRMATVAEKNTIFQPNAGLPRFEGGRTFFDATPEEYAKFAEQAVDSGASIVGGCCGSRPEHIAALKETVESKTPLKLKRRNYFYLCTPQNFFRYDLSGKDFLVIGERINPSNREDLKNDLSNESFELVLKEAKSQENAGADVLDINVSIPLADEKHLLSEVVRRLAYSTSIPISIDTTDPEALEAALKIYPGRPIVNSVNANENSLNTSLSVASRFGAPIIALAVTGRSVPKSAEGKLEALEIIFKEAERRGYSVYDILFDPGVLPAATASAKETLKSIKELRKKGLYTVIGLSNVSTGLPDRKVYNRALAVLAASYGLSAAILDPLDSELVKLIKASRFVVKLSTELLIEPNELTKEKVSKEIKEASPEDDLYSCIVSGNKERAEKLVRLVLEDLKPYDVVFKIISPAMEEVGTLFAEKKIFLPQVLMSAETVKKVFEIIKPEIIKAGDAVHKARVLLATVEGDVHDIGKGIVGAILEANGYEVFDLGVDVKVEEIINSVERFKPDVVGLSCLMTTTLPSLEKSVRELKKRFEGLLVAIGGAIVSENVKNAYNADIYSKDAVGFAKILNEIFQGE